MIFEFFKKLFFKADEDSRKRKVEESVINVPTEAPQVKRFCHGSSMQQPQIDETITSHHTYHQSENENKFPAFKSNMLERDILFRHSKRTNDILPYTSRTLARNGISSKRDFTLAKQKALNSTLNETMRLNSRKQYDAFLQNYMSLNLSQSKPKKIQEQLLSSTRDSLKSNDTFYSLDDKSILKKVEHSRAKLSRSMGSDKSSFLRINKKNSSDSINEIEDKTSKINIEYSPVQVIKVNTLKENLSNKAVLKHDYLESITKKYNDRIKQRQKEAEELQKMTEILSRQNRLIREAILENQLNYSTQICEEILDESKLDKKPKLPKLSPDMLEKVKSALSPGPGHQVLVEDFGLRITRKDMQTLAGLNWLNDEVINFYMNLLIKRGNLDDYPNVYAMNTFFYPKLVSTGHASLKRWTRKVDIFSKDLVVVPVHLGVHWCMSVIDLRNKSIRYYDSMGSPNWKCVQALKQYLMDESMDKKKKSYDLSNWTFECLKDIPQQQNGSDCGVFSCVFAEHICANREFNFSQDDMPYFRNKMVYEILTDNIL